MQLSAAVQSLSVCCCIGLALAVLPGAYGGELFAWHPLFMAVGFLGFMTEGILAAYRFRATDGGARVQAIQNHGWIQAAATVAVASGFLAIYRNKASGAELLAGVACVASARWCARAAPPPRAPPAERCPSRPPCPPHPAPAAAVAARQGALCVAARQGGGPQPPAGGAGPRAGRGELPEDGAHHEAARGPAAAGEVAAPHGEWSLGGAEVRRGGGPLW